MMIAANAQPILSARLRGYKPDEMVMISLVGPVRTANQVVYAKADEVYDWRWVRGLDICVRIGDEPNWAPLLRAIARHQPDYLCVWHEPGQWGAQVRLLPTLADLDKPRVMWACELDFSEWLDFQNRDFAEGRKYERDEQGIPYESHP